MNVNLSFGTDQALISLRGRFDFSSRLDFKQGCTTALEKPAIRELVIDMRELEYLDSAALGMLLLLNDKGACDNKLITLRVRAGIVCEILRISKFDKLFKFEQT